MAGLKSDYGLLEDKLRLRLCCGLLQSAGGCYVLDKEKQKFFLTAPPFSVVVNEILYGHSDTCEGCQECSAAAAQGSTQGKGHRHQQPEPDSRYLLHSHAPSYISCDTFVQP